MQPNDDLVTLNWISGTRVSYYVQIQFEKHGDCSPIPARSQIQYECGSNLSEIQSARLQASGHDEIFFLI